MTVDDIERRDREFREACDICTRLQSKYFPDPSQHAVPPGSDVDVRLDDLAAGFLRSWEIADFMLNRAPEPDRSDYRRAHNRRIS
ncbi:hypothetical protein ACNSPR_31115 [Klebsiella pneumoniae]